MGTVDKTREELQRAEDESYAAWLLSGDGIIPFPPEFRTYPAQDFAAKVLNRVAESLTIGSRDLTLEPDLEFLMYDYMDIIGTEDETLQVQFINAVVVQATQAIVQGDATSLLADVVKIRDGFLARVTESSGG